MLKATVIKVQLKAAHKGIYHLPGGPKHYPPSNIKRSLLAYPTPPTQVTFSIILYQCLKNVSSASAMY